MRCQKLRSYTTTMPSTSACNNDVLYKQQCASYLVQPCFAFFLLLLLCDALVDGCLSSTCPFLFCHGLRPVAMPISCGSVQYHHVRAVAPCTLGFLGFFLLFLALSFPLLLELEPSVVRSDRQRAELSTYFCILSSFLACLLLMGAALSPSGWGGVAASPACAGSDAAASACGSSVMACRCNAISSVETVRYDTLHERY